MKVILTTLFLLCAFVQITKGENMYLRTRMQLAGVKHANMNNDKDWDSQTVHNLEHLMHMKSLLQNLDDDTIGQCVDEGCFDVNDPIQETQSIVATSSNLTTDGKDISASTISANTTSAYSTEITADGNMHSTNTTDASNASTFRPGTTPDGVQNATSISYTHTTTKYSTERTTGSNVQTTATIKTTTYTAETTTVIPKTTAPLVYNVSPLCLNHTKAILAGLFARQNWALRMIDAAGKPVAGLMEKNINWRGNYDECVGVNAISDISQPPYRFKGQYCTVTIGNGPVQINPLTGKPIGLDIGLCLPDTCNNHDVTDLLNSVIRRASNNSFYVITTICQNPLTSYDTRAIIVLCVIAMFIIVMASATAYDIIMIQWSKSAKKDSIEITTNEKSHVNGSIHGETNGGYTADKYPTSEIKYKLSGEINGDLPTYDDSFTEKPTYKPGLLGKLLLSFSVYTNGSKLLSTHQGAGTLTAVNGIRFISMTWVILGHSYAFGLPNVSNAATILPQLTSRRSFMAIINAEVSVDTFFALSGCLLTYLVLKQLKNQKGKLNWFMFYFHRFWRLTPPYMLAMMVHISLFPYLGSGPIWPRDGTEINYCEKTWWYNLLYIQNFIAVEKQCFVWAWYLANDMQFFIISPLIILPLYLNKIAGIVVVSLFLLGTTITAAVISIHYGLGVSTFSGDFVSYFEQYYIRPYTRMGPYLIGMIAGYVLYKTKCKCKINKYLNLALWAIFIAAACSALYGVYDDLNGKPFSKDVSALYNAVHKTVWGAAICWVIFACATGNGGFINTILSWKGFVPLSRLTYCAYLIHPPIIYYYVFSRRQLTFWDDHQVIYEFLANLVLSYAVAFITSLAFESPMMGLEKVIFKRGEKKKN